MSTSTPCPEDHPLMIAWKAHQATEDFANSKKWAAYPEHLQGSLWGLFMAGFLAGAAPPRASPPETTERQLLASCADAMRESQRHWGSTGTNWQSMIKAIDAHLAASSPETAGVLVPPPHPESQVMKWSALELAAIKAYGERCWCAGRSTGASDETKAAP